MSSKVRLCNICLRADKSLKAVDSTLSEFHDELCDFALMAENPEYCEECLYLLKKVYKFKMKCVLACKVFSKWKKTKAAEKKSPYLLYTLLPSFALNVWTANTSTIYDFVHEETDNNTYRELITHINVGRERGSNENEVTESNSNVINDLETFTYVIGDSKSDVSLTQNHANVETEVDLSSFQPHVVVLPVETSSHDPIEGKESNGHIVKDYAIKMEIDAETDEKSFELKDVLKLEDTTNLDEVPFKNDGSSLNGKTEIKSQNFQNELDNIQTDGTKLKSPYINSKINKSKKKSLDEFYCSDIDDFLDASSTDSDDVKIKSKTNQIKNNTKAKPLKKSLNKLIDDISIDSQDVTGSTKKKRMMRSSTDKRNVNKDDASKIDNDSDLTKNDKEENDEDDEEDDKSLMNLINEKKVKVKRKKEVVGGKMLRFHTKRYICADLLNVEEDVKESVFGINNRKGVFSKERLISQLRSLFASCGELTTDEGLLIDKEYIIECIDDKVTEFVVRQLWNSVRGTKIIKPRALKLITCIQKKYKNDYDSIFDIEYLNTKEKILKEFQDRKNYECYVNAEFKCEICFQGFKHEKKLEYHKKCHDESAGNFICSVCGVRQKNKKGLIGHMNNGHEAIYRCKLCPLVTYYKFSMVNHHQLHKGVKFRCEQCDATFGSKSAHSTHLSYRHQKKHICTTCGRAFSTETGLKWHNTRQHRDTPLSDVLKALCADCSLGFPTPEALAKHVAVSHQPRLRGRRPGTSIIPRRTIKKKPVLTCRVCSTVGHSVGWLDLHYRLEHPTVDVNEVQYADKKVHLCHVCGKGFTTIYTLKHHLNTHTDVRPYACSLCPKRFHRALSLQQHKLFHLPPSKSCTYCNKKFRTQSNLYNHIRFHVGDRRYKCKLCGKGFLHRCTLNEHVRGVHLNERRVRKRAVETRTLSAGST